ncbi:MAG: hypothetical protein R2867_09380 [Caldilineaceae bacterium]
MNWRERRLADATIAQWHQGKIAARPWSVVKSNPLAERGLDEPILDVVLEPLEKELAKLREQKFLERLMDAIDKLQDDPRPHGFKPPIRSPQRQILDSGRIVAHCLQIKDKQLLIVIIWAE